MDTNVVNSDEVETKPSDGAKDFPPTTSVKEKQPHYKRYIPLASDVSKSIDLKLLKKEKNLLDAEDALEETKDDIEGRLGTVELRRGFLKNREKQYFASLITFEDLLVKADMEWKTVIKRINETNTIQETRAEQVTELRNESTVAERKRDILNGFVRKYGPCQTFVLNVINLSEEYEKVKDVSDEYTCLRYAYEELSQTEAVLQKEMDALRKKEIKFFSIRSGRKLAHDVLIELLNISLEQIKFGMVELENAFFTTTEINLARKIDLGRIHMGIEHMFCLICKNRLFVLKSPGCHLEMLKKIAEFIVDWSDVVNEVSKLAAEQRPRQRRPAYERRKIRDVLIP